MCGDLVSVEGLRDGIWSSVGSVCANESRWQTTEAWIGEVFCWSMDSNDANQELRLCEQVPVVPTSLWTDAIDKFC